MRSGGRPTMRVMIRVPATGQQAKPQRWHHPLIGQNTHGGDLLSGQIHLPRLTQAEHEGDHAVLTGRSADRAAITIDQHAANGSSGH